MVCWRGFWWFLPSLLEGPGVLWTLLCGLRHEDWSLFTWRHIALKRRADGREDVEHEGSRKKMWGRERDWMSHEQGEALLHSLNWTFLCYFWSCDSPLFVRMWCFRGARPEGISGWSVVCRSAVTRTAAAMMHPTSERQATDWRAGLKQEVKVSEWRKRGSLFYVFFLFVLIQSSHTHAKTEWKHWQTLSQVSALGMLIIMKTQSLQLLLPWAERSTCEYQLSKKAANNMTCRKLEGHSGVLGHFRLVSAFSGALVAISMYCILGYIRGGSSE